MVWFKRCPRCKDGDMSESADLYGRFVVCAQCGYYPTDAEESALRTPSRLWAMASSRPVTVKKPAVAIAL